MNKIRLYNDYIKDSDLDGNIQIEKIRKTDLFTVNQIKIKVIKDAEILVEFTGNKEVKLDIYIEVLANVKCNIIEEKSNLNFKVRYTYTLNDNSSLDLKKYYFNNDVRELNIINLKNKAKLNYYINTISKQRERYDVILYQNYKQSISQINVKSLNLSSNLDFNINNFEEGEKNKINLYGKIITKDIELCNINTNIKNTLANNIVKLNEKIDYLKEFSDNKFIEET